jgi:biopolymer transport protein ExbD
MRTYRKREWAPLGFNATPLIDVVFLLNIFFLLTLNFSDLLMRQVTLPKADEAQKERVEPGIERVQVTVKSDGDLFVGTRKVTSDTFVSTLSEITDDPTKTTIQLLGDEDVAYEVVQLVMQKIASLGITRIEFSTRKEPVAPFEKDTRDEATPKGNH